MPRDTNGNYTLPSGNPVVSGEVISTGWANPTMSDVAQALTDSLDRKGNGGMLGPFKFADGTVSAPGMSWTAEPTSGFYRAGLSDMRAVIAGVPRMRWTGTGVDVWDSAASAWLALSNVSGNNLALLNSQNTFTQGQYITNTSGSLTLFKDVSQSLGGRIGFNLGSADSLSLAFSDGVSWKTKFAATATLSSYLNDGHHFFAGDGTTRRMYLTSGGLQVGAPGYSPTGSSAAYIGLTHATGPRAEIGIHIADGTELPRVALFTNFTSKRVGLDYTFSTGAYYFEFRRAGVAIFRYAEDAVSILSGNKLTMFNAGNANSRSLVVGSTDAVVDTRGALLHWVDTALVNGRITLATTTPAATGGAGQIVFVYE